MMLSTYLDGNLTLDEDTAAYYVALTWSKIMMAAKGDLLAQQEKELWKMGADISGREALLPSLSKVSRNDSFDWVLIGAGVFWFPRKRDGYKGLWDTLSCRKSSFGSLVEKVRNREFDKLEQTACDVAAFYKHALEDQHANAPKLPPRLLGGVFARRWAAQSAEAANLDLLLESYFAGVPAEYLLAG